jgi:glycosyltransferase involved in cell wall biosynthesis
MNKTIAYLYPDYGAFTGGQRAVLRFLRAVPARLGAHPLLITTAESRLSDEARAAGISTSVVALPESIAVMSVETLTARSVVSVASELRRFRHAVDEQLHAHDVAAVVVRSLPMVLLTMKLRRTSPVIWDMGMEKRGASVRLLQRFALQGVDAVVGESDSMFTWTFGKRPRGVALLGNPYGLAASEAPIRPHAVRQSGLVCVASLTPRKGQHILLEALSAITNPPVTHFIGGAEDPAYARHLLELVDRLELTTHVRFHGYRDDAHQFIADSRCLVLPSMNEGLPTVLLEAISTRTPIVATTVGAIPGVFQDGRHMRLVAPGEVEPLREAVRWVLDQPHLADEMANRAAALAADQLSLDAWADRYAAFIEMLIG